MKLLFSTCVMIFTILNTASCHGQWIVAHRGASHDAPENTLAAFQLAWRQKADAIEGDFYLTKDKRIVCIHDKTTKRTAPNHPARIVAETRLQELRQLDVGSWKGAKFADERIPTLTEVLATVPDGKLIFIEIKCGSEIIPHLKQELENSSLSAKQIVIISFDQSVISAARTSMPHIKANWLTSYRRGPTEESWNPSLDSVLQTLKDTGATGLGTHGNQQVIDQAFARALRAAKFELHVWTVNDAQQARYFAELGASSITTDNPHEIRTALQGNNAEE